MSNEHTTFFAMRPEMTLGELVMGLAEHFKTSGTDNAEFEFDGLDNGHPVKMAFSISMRKVQ